MPHVAGFHADFEMGHFIAVEITVSSRTPNRCGIGFPCGLRSCDVTGFSLLAYFDPGPGSLLLQAIIGGSAGALVFGRYLFSQMLLRFRGLKVDQVE
jgi:hypothetical protein